MLTLCLKRPDRRLGSRLACRVGALLIASSVTASAIAASTLQDCHVGAYRLPDGRTLDIAPTESENLRWRLFDGETGALVPQADGRWKSLFGWTGRPDGKTVTFSDCATNMLSFDGAEGRRIPLDVVDTSFISHGSKLLGRLVMPKGKGPFPVAILTHGGEHDSARDWYFLQRMFPSQGVGAFVFDKRGTGGSGGQYTQDFSLLADDVVAAMHEARRLAGKRAGRIGYQGGSQAGWILPIAASRAPVDFVIVSFGLAVSVIAEDQEEVALEMRLKGHSPAETAKALEVAAAVEEIFGSHMTTGYDRFERVRAKYRNQPWYKDLHGNFTWILLPYSGAELRKKASEFNWHTPAYYDPLATLAAAKVPELWVSGSDDLEAPSAPTAARIRRLIAKGHPFTLAIEPGAEHGMTEYEMKNGERISTRYSAGYFEMMRDFARDGMLRRPYGNAQITPAPK